MTAERSAVKLDVSLADSARDRFVAAKAGSQLEDANAWRKENGLPMKPVAGVESDTAPEN